MIASVAPRRDELRLDRLGLSLRRPRSGTSVWASSSAAASSGSPMCFHALTAAQAMAVDAARTWTGSSPRAVTAGDGRAAGRKGVEEPDDGTGGGRAGRPQPHRHLGDHAERALGADHEPDQVVAGHALRGAAPEPHDLPGRRDHLQRQHVVACHAVLHAAQPAGVRGDVAADRRNGGARRVGRVPQAVLGGGLAQVVVHHAGLDDRQPLAGVDLDDGAHLFGAQDHAPVHGVRAARDPVPAPRVTIGTP